MESKEKGGYGSAFLLWGLAFIVPLMPHVVLKTPFWGILIYTALTLAGIQGFLNLPLFIWGLIVELQRAQYDVVFWLFIVAFVLYVVYLVIAYIIPYISERRIRRMLRYPWER